MKLLTKEIERKLRKNAQHAPGDRGTQPVVKFFNPAGAGTWLFTELDGDTLYGLCDPGLGSPELGYASLAEMSEFKGRFGLGIERDMWFTPKFTLQEYAE